MKKIFTLFLSVFFCTMAFAQTPNVMIKKASVAPVIDGVVDDVWAVASKQNIDKPFQTETPTLGQSGETTWQGLWTDDGVYLLLKVTDNEFYPAYKNSASDSWMYDKPEFYFDVNAEKKDGLGGHNNYGNRGHYQIAPGFLEAEIDGTLHDDGAIGMHAFKVTAPTYVAEYFVPFSYLIDQNGNEVNITQPIGFDVTIIDGEPATPGLRQRAVWSNDGNGPAANESWGNMDDCGLIMFYNATELIYVEKVEISGGNAVTTDNGTLQLTATVEPVEATVQKVKWVVENGTGRATIDSKGVLTGIVDGTVVVKAIAKDGTGVEDKMTVTISGQNLTLDEINMIKNGNFDKGFDGKQDWYGGTVLDGMLDVYCTVKTNIWDTMFGQGNLPIADAETPYTVKFKAVATEDMTVPMLFEDRSNTNNKAVYSISEWRDNEYGKWDIPITTVPKWYTIDVIFSAWIENSAYELNFQLGLADGTFSIDSIYMYNDPESDFLVDDFGVGVMTLSDVNKVKLWPNPVQTELTVSRITVPNSKVSVYNTVGQKLMEKTANRNQAKFDVANLRKGIYFVRFSDGSSEKFIKE
jgi:hypothetical protein